jgi:hypothetical protein
MPWQAFDPFLQLRRARLRLRDQRRVDALADLELSARYQIFQR